MLKKIKCRTKKDFKEKYIINLYNKEKGLNEIDANKFQKDNKIIRNLSQISYRLLNYILYCHLFFARLYTNLDDKFDIYLPKGMNWFNTIYECYILLKKELEKKGIKQIGIFMNYIFKDLFDKLHNRECINNFEELIKFENELEKLIQDKFNRAKIKIDKYKKLEKKYISNENSGIALLKEIYNKDKYSPKIYPYYEYFYYTEYLDEEKINKILEHKDKNEYPVLCKYLEYKKQKKIDTKFSSENFIIFNKALNLFIDIYSNQISREYAEKTIIKYSDIYKNPENKKLIDEFIKLYNSFDLKEGEGKNIELNIYKNYIYDFLLVDENKYGKTYKNIYEIFIKNQNKELENLLDKKIDKGIFNDNCKNRINIQQIKEDEIFTLDITKKFNFISVLCNSSYRRVIDTENYENYNEYEISLDSIESKMTDLLLKNKKLVNNELIGFSFNNEIFRYEYNDLFNNFKYNDGKIGIEDKIILYNYITENDGNNEKYKIIISNFVTLIEYLNKIKKDENNSINENTKICEIGIKNISEDFKKIFENKENLTVNKLANLFDYFLKKIFKYVKKDIEKYQDKKENNKKQEQKNIYKIYLDEIVIKKLDDFFKTDNIINKESLTSAIRLFLSLVLYREDEKDKDIKIKSNRKNIVEYLKEKYLWESKIYNDIKFKDNLGKIKSLNIKIKEILWFYYYLINNKDEGFENEVKEFKKKLEEEEERIRKEKEERELEDKDEEIQKNISQNFDKDSSEDDDDNSDDDNYDEDDDDSDDSEDEDEDNKKRRKNKRKKRRNMRYARGKHEDSD